MLQNTQHTPGPWEVCGKQIMQSPYQTGYEVVPEVRGATIEQRRANARLIAAAPEMLEQLKLVKRYIEMGAPDGVLRDNEIAGIASAIAKATPASSVKEAA